MENSIHYLFVVGNPVNHSLSPLIHNTALYYLKLEEKYFYFSVEIQTLEQVKRLFLSPLFKGASVTMPFKEKIFALIDKKNISAEANTIEAINTVYVRNGKLFGTNTDWIGVTNSLADVLDLKKLENKKCLILGSGGAAKACIFAALKLKMQVTVYSRSKTGEEVYPTNPEKITVINEITDTTDIKIVMNATPLGMKGKYENKTPIKKSLLKKDMICFDCIYAPRETKFLKEAKKVGAQTINGLEMLLYQGVEAFKLWTGKQAPIEVMRKAIEEKLNN